ncbi:MAG TPA: DUF1232 domain-containing protein [Gemmatimonadaceae bacterium]|nr:DUF1232 domain-containing protein [Gemmatimonadaceae bacterium]
MSPRSSADAVRGLGKRVKQRVAGPRRGARRTVGRIIRQLPHYGRLLAGLMADRRVSKLDRVLVGAALAYLLLPLDFIADYVPFLGQVDDVFLLMTALQRLVSHAGRRVLRDHWTGDPRELRHLDIPAVVNAAAFFLPGRMRRSLLSLLR